MAFWSPLIETIAHLFTILKGIEGEYGELIVKYKGGTITFTKKYNEGDPMSIEVSDFLLAKSLFFSFTKQSISHKF